jgi:hypothetical protein
MQTCGGGTGPLCLCFQDVNPQKYLTYAQLRDYNAAWETFRRVELYNSNVSTVRGGGQGMMTSNLNYYQFFSQQEQATWRTGSVLFFTYLGYSTIVQKN